MKQLNNMLSNAVFVIILMSYLFTVEAPAQSNGGVKIGLGEYGLFLGNTHRAKGLRINWSDSHVDEITGMNITLWRPAKKPTGVIKGVSVGLFSPSADILKGVNIGGLGVAAETELSGLNIGLLGVGSGGDINGISFGIFGVGSGENINGITVSGFGAGAGGNVTGITIGGFGVGAGGNSTGLLIGLFGAGAGENMKGIHIAGFGLGAGGSITGLSIGGFGIGAGKNIEGVNLSLIGIGAGEMIKGLNIAGIGVGSESIEGITFGGLGVGANNIRGITLSLGRIKVVEGGELTGFSASAYNRIEGTQHGVTIGIVNYAENLRGLQIGLLNLAPRNPKGRKILPFINWN